MARLRILGHAIEIEWQNVRTPKGRLRAKMEPRYVLVEPCSSGSISIAGNYLRSLMVEPCANSNAAKDHHWDN